MVTKKKPVVNKGVSPIYGLMATVTQVNTTPLYSLRERYGGQVNLVAQPLDKKVVYRWKVESHDCMNFLNDIQPFLLVKAAEANLALTYYEINDRVKHTLTPATLAHRENIRVTLQQLKKEDSYSHP